VHQVGFYSSDTRISRCTVNKT